ncbi:unnamed protein product [Symbiodinium natans]|uniref:Uncharacterized protein n=1 Tax=Symbiodinium natans TaxID=878477 RepID=A0A812NLB6_9DINO|nr:unnamed protein product [Symbiodinium natans]
MPNGDRLDFVPGGAPPTPWQKQDKFSPPAPLQLQDEPSPERTKPQPKRKIKAEVEDGGKDVYELMWESVEAVVKDEELRAKLWKFLRRTYPVAIQEAASPVALLSGWATDTAWRLAQAAWQSPMLSHSTAGDIVAILKRMREGGALPESMAGDTAWDPAFEQKLEALVAAQLSRAIPSQDGGQGGQGVEDAPTPAAKPTGSPEVETKALPAAGPKKGAQRKSAKGSAKGHGKAAKSEEASGSKKRSGKQEPAQAQQPGAAPGKGAPARRLFTGALQGLKS